MFQGINGFQQGGLTANAGTAITCLIPSRKGSFTRLTRVLYRCGATAHVISFMKCLGKTTLAAAVAASGTSVTLSADPGTGTPASGIANNDWVAIRLDNGKFFLTTVSSLSTLTFTSGAFPTAAAAGNSVYFFGLPADHASTQTNPAVNPTTGYQVTCTASVMNDWGDAAAGILQSSNPDEPLLVHSANGANAGTFELISGCHTRN